MTRCAPFTRKPPYCRVCTRTLDPVLERGIRKDYGDTDRVKWVIATSFSELHARIRAQMRTETGAVVMLPCKHTMHARCARDLIVKRHATKCPQCDREIDFWFSRYKAVWFNSANYARSGSIAKRALDRMPVCTNCGVQRVSRTCAKCKTRPYCSQVCMRADWGEHKELCGGDARVVTLSGTPLEFVAFVIEHGCGGDAQCAAMVREAGVRM